MYQRGYEDPDEFTDIFPAAVDAIVYGKEYPVGESSIYERMMSYNLPGGNKDPQESQAEADKESERLSNWKANFPYKPTTNPDVVITERMANYGKPESGDPTVVHNHCYLRNFFESEARSTAQFEQLYHILEEHGRGDNPVATGQIFNRLSGVSPVVATSLRRR